MKYGIYLWIRIGAELRHYPHETIANIIDLVDGKVSIVFESGESIRSKSGFWGIASFRPLPPPCPYATWDEKEAKNFLRLVSEQEGKTRFGGKDA